MKVMYMGNFCQTLARLTQSFEVVPLDLEKVPVKLETGGTWPVYKHVPTDIGAIVVDTNVQNDPTIKIVLDYAMCFSIPFILCCPFKVYSPLHSTLELHSLDCKIGYVSPYSDMFEHLAAFVMSVIDMPSPYRLQECPTID